VSARTQWDSYGRTLPQPRMPPRLVSSVWELAQPEPKVDAIFVPSPEYMGFAGRYVPSIEASCRGGARQRAAESEGLGASR